MRNTTIFTILASLLFFSVTASQSYAQQVNIAQPNPDKPEYVEGRYVIRYPEGYQPAIVEEEVARRENLSTLKKLQENISFTLKGQDSPEKRFEALSDIQSELQIKEQTSVGPESDFYAIQLETNTPLEQVEATVKDAIPGAEVEQVPIAYLFTTPNDQYYDKMWQFANMRAEEAWSVTTGSSDIIVAVVDSGVQVSHPDLQGNIVKSTGMGSCPDNSDPVGHGTHVSGTIGANSNNSTGVTGINWKVKVYGYSVLCGSGGTGSLDVVAAGINQAVADGAKVINMSLGAYQGASVLHQAIINAVNHGVVVVAAAGNDKTSQPSYPASYPEVISVSATGPNNELANYSNYGNTVDIAAPGGNPSNGSSTCTVANCIASTYPSNGYKALAGTSMASPQIAGAAALVLSANPSLSVAQVKSVLFSTAKNIGPSNKFGAGLVDLKAAVDKAKTTTGEGNGTPPTGSQPTAQPTSGTNPPTGTQPTAQPTSGTNPPTSPISHPCLDKAKLGNYNCDDTTDNNDIVSWEEQFEKEQAPLAPYFEWIRSKIYNTQT